MTSMKIGKQYLMKIAGGIWLLIGSLLMYKGSHYLLDSQSLSFAGVENGVVLIITLALLLGFLKGRKVLSKVVERESSRITKTERDTTLFDLYSRNQWIIIFSMVSLGFLFRLLSLDPLLRGFIDITIGSALVHGAMHYFRLATIHA